MKKLMPISLLVLALTFSGCAWTQRHTPWHHHDQSPATRSVPAASQTAAIVTPDESLTAKVLAVNAVGRFVVLNFPNNRMPRLEQHLFLYRGGLKTAEVKVVGPQQETSIVADIVSGDAAAGDTVRDQ